MSTIKTVNVIHPSGVTNNIVTDDSGNVAVGGNLTPVENSDDVQLNTRAS
jgi:hypothetical protein